MLAPGGRLYLPTGTIQNEKPILAAAREVFGDRMEPVLEREFPLPDLVAKSKAVAQMVKDGIVSFRQRGSRLAVAAADLALRRASEPQSVGPQHRDRVHVVARRAQVVGAAAIDREHDPRDVRARPRPGPPRPAAPGAPSC